MPYHVVSGGNEITSCEETLPIPISLGILGKNCLAWQNLTLLVSRLYAMTFPMVAPNNRKREGQQVLQCTCNMDIIHLMVSVSLSLSVGRSK